MKQHLIGSIVLALFVVAAVSGLVFFGTPSYLEQILEAVYSRVSPGTLSYVQVVVVTLGVTISVLIGYIAYLLSAGKARAELLARGLTREHVIAIAQLRQLYDQSPVPYLTLHADGSIHNPNLAAMRLYGMSSEELQGASFKMHPDEDLERAQSLFARFSSNVPFDREEIRIVRKDGVVRWVMLSILLFHQPWQRKRRGLATLVDITEQKELDQAKTEFVSLASHQLNTPLTTVKWHTEILLSGKHGELNEKQRMYLDQVHEGNQQMIDLVSMLLNVSRIEMGTLQVEKKDTDVPDIVASVMRELVPQIEEKQLSVSKEYAEGLRAVQTDPRLLRIVVQNLISNAVKYTPAGGRIVVRLKRQKGRFVISVIDTGVGIPKDQQHRIFTKMFRAENAKTQNVEGNGLGLYLVKSIVELLGGSISFVSEINRGSTFTVRLP